MNVSVVIIVKNASRTIQRCLESVAGFDDVVLVDTGSTDETLEIARHFPEVRIEAIPFSGFDSTRNRAALFAQNDWILPLDADEWMTEALTEEISNFEAPGDRVVLSFWRHNWFAGTALRSKRLGREWIRRIYHRQAVKFEGAVHERLVLVDGTGRPRVAELKGKIGHEPYADVGHLFQKRWFYAQPELRRLKSAGPFMAMTRALWRFIRGYFLQGGMIDGWRGFLLVSADAYGVYLKYVWAFAEKKKLNQP